MKNQEINKILAATNDSNKNLKINYILIDEKKKRKNF